MMPEWLKEDGSFTDDWLEKAGIPEDMRDYAKGAKDIKSLVQRGHDTQREFHARVKIPDDEEGKRGVLQEHFQDVLDADAKAMQKKREADAEAARKQQAKDAAAEAEKLTADRQKKVKTLLGGEDGKDFDKNMEHARRAMRSDRMPQMVKDALAAAVDAESFDKVSDDQIREVLGRDPMMAVLAQSYGEMLADGRLQSDDGHHGGGKKGDHVPMQPDCPQVYIGLPAGDPNREYFEKQGWDMSGSVPVKK